MSESNGLEGEGWSDYQVTLPVAKNDFADFVGRLISGSDKLEYAIISDIEVTRDTLLGLESSFSERVDRQAGSAFVATRYSIKFSDGRGFKTGELSKIFDLSPTGTVHTEALTAEYTFINNYPNSNAPVREVVSLSFRARSMPRYVGRFVLAVGNIEVEYHNRSWAEDVLESVKRVVCVEAPSFSDARFLLRNTIFAHEEVPVIVGIVSSIIFLTTIYFAWDTFVFEGLRVVSPIGASNHAEPSPEKLVVRGLTFLSIAILIGVLVGVSISKVGSPEAQNIVFRITDSDQRYLDYLKSRKRKSRFKIILSIIGSIVLSVVASWIYGAIFT
ncbi:hypothetical protein ACROSR_11630 [Roseovarius tibetensis]|uniref:hypothetical protein n=1 Tax=Roseovarius tibetensis TaxID=2685897 RepID=UPI003D7F9D57